MALYVLVSPALDKKDKIKDLGVTFDYQLTFHDHIQEKVNRAYSMLGLIKRNFIYMDSNTFILLYTSLVRPHLEYANAVCCPYKIGDIEVIEKVQKRATKLVVCCRQVKPQVTMASPKESGDDASSAVSSSDVVVTKTENDEQLDNAHSDFLQHFENEIRISQPDCISLTKSGSSAGGATVPDSSSIRTPSQLQHRADSNSSAMFPTDDASDVLSTPDPYVLSNFVGAATDMFVIGPALSSRIER